MWPRIAKHRKEWKNLGEGFSLPWAVLTGQLSWTELDNKQFSLKINPTFFKIL